MHVLKVEGMKIKNQNIQHICKEKGKEESNEKKEFIFIHC